MRVFVTGATGFIGSAVVSELLGAGHLVLGMTRSDAGEAALVAAGAEVHRGELEDPASLRRGAAQADGVIHCAFDHDFSRFVANCEKDRLAVEALGAELAGSQRPLLITSGVGMGQAAPGQDAREDVFDADHPNPRRASELAGIAALQAGASVAVMRLPQVHNTVKQGLITPLVELAREKRVSAFVGDGRNRWPAVHVRDAALLYRLALERHKAGARYHAVAEAAVAMRDIAEVIGRGLGVPMVALSSAEASAHFGWLAMFAEVDMPASSAQTQQKLGWRPTGPGLIADLEGMNYRLAA